MSSDDDYEVVWDGAKVDHLGTKGGLGTGYVPSSWSRTVEHVIKGKSVECLISPGSDENESLPSTSE